MVWYVIDNLSASINLGLARILMEIDSLIKIMITKKETSAEASGRVDW